MGNKSGRRSGHRDRNRAQDDDRYGNREHQAKNRSENRDNISHSINNTFSDNPTYSKPRQPLDRYDVQNTSHDRGGMSAGDNESAYARPECYERDRNEARHEDRYGSRGDGANNRRNVPMMNNTFPENSPYSEPRQGAHRSNAQNMNYNPERRIRHDAEYNYTRQAQYCDRDRNEPQNEDRYGNRGHYAENRDNISRLVNDTYSGDLAYPEPTQGPDHFSDQNINYNPERRSAHHSEYTSTRQDYYEHDRHEPQREDRYESRAYQTENRDTVPHTMNKPFSGNPASSEPRQSSDRFNSQNMSENPEGMSAYHSEYSNTRQGYYDHDRNEPQNDERYENCRYRGEHRAENRDNNPRMTNDTSANLPYPDPMRTPDHFIGHNMSERPENSVHHPECSRARQDYYCRDRDEPQSEERWVVVHRAIIFILSLL
ncbi:hypothetical protein ANCCAN_30599 [Ancylostoma caninum]|uniref:Uncharacterized protein n=1 Tax=Ancylostoma caninum TaxID=29170 RepID=A0A368EVP3_ANCCA|nr:hypothetical protein ANCCAN_30599 [Ancylostoma caninum]